VCPRGAGAPGLGLGGSRWLPLVLDWGARRIREDVTRVTITEVDLFADALGDGRGEGDLGATFLDAVLKRAEAANVR